MVKKIGTIMKQLDFSYGEIFTIKIAMIYMLAALELRENGYSLEDYKRWLKRQN